jgi:hypothetical protein
MRRHRIADSPEDRETTGEFASETSETGGSRQRVALESLTGGDWRRLAATGGDWRRLG